VSYFPQNIQSHKIVDIPNWGTALPHFDLDIMQMGAALLRRYKKHMKTAG
jgi:hypothetical protein